MYPDNLTRAEARERFALIKTHSYQVQIDLTGRGVDQPDSMFRSTSTVQFSAAGNGRCHIDLIADSVLSATLDGIQLDPMSFADPRLPFSVTPGEHVLRVAATFRYSHSGDGLHRFVDPADDRVYLYTQFEVADARRVYACFEQPDLKARFSIDVLAPSGWTVVSNGACLSSEPLEDIRHDDSVTRHVFAETLPISTYLTAVVAGEYHVEQRSHDTAAGRVPMSILCRQSLAPHLDGDRLHQITTSGFDVFEKHFGYPYPFGKYDQVFVPEYNSGAMENVGCVVIRDEYVFRSRQTKAGYQVRANTILHELSHMWFGDLVTMKWWDDLWLKESFATWAATFAASEALEDPTSAWSTFSNGNKNWAYRQDQLPTTHPIAADMADLEAIELNFDGITYAKGASVVVQLVAFVGQEAFLKGLRSYFAEHAFGNTELVDLLRALEEASDRDLSHWSGEWLETAGVNTLSADFDLDRDGRFRSVRIKQTADQTHPTLRSHRIAIGLYARTGNTLQRIQRVEADLSGPSTTIPELDGTPQPDLLLPNDDDLSYTKVRLDRRSLQTAVDHIDEVGSPLARALLWNATWDMCRDAELPANQYVELVLRGVATESDLTAVRSILGQAQSAANSYAPVPVRSRLLARWQSGVCELLAHAAPGSDHQLALTRSFAAAAEDSSAAELIHGWLSGHSVPKGLAIDPELRWTLVTNLARLGWLDDTAISTELERDATITGAQQAAGARAAQPSAAAKVNAWRLAVEDDTIPNGTQSAICVGFWQRGQDELLAPYIARYFEAAEAISSASGIWATRGISMRNNVLRYLFPWPVEKQTVLLELDSWLERTELTASVRRIIDERRDELIRALRCQAAAALVA
jgi:aminopeptidase N